MKKIIFFLLVIISSELCFSQQIKVAIVDFDNLSGIAKYDGLGKAMSSMLISDIEANVSPKRLQLIERSQINKILKEQNFQKTASVDKASTVKLGKLLGVRYLLVGDIFVLNDALVINSRLIDTETGAIKLSEKKEGKLTQWLFLKTTLAKELSASISMPFTEPVMLDKEINAAVVTAFSNAISENDKGNFEKAEVLISTTKEFDPGFKYLEDLKVEVERLKVNVEKLQIEVETTVSDPAQAAQTYFQNKNFLQAIKYFTIGINRIPNTEYGKKYPYFLFLSEAYLENKNFIEAVAYADSTLFINPFEVRAIFFKASALIKLNRQNEGISLLKKIINENKILGNMDLIMSSLYNISKNKKSLIFKGLVFKHQAGSIEFDEKIQYVNYEEFKKDLGDILKRKLIKISSDNYEFEQNYNLDELIFLYTDLLSSLNIDPILIAKSIDEFEWGNDQSDKFYNIYKTDRYGNTLTGTIADKNTYVFADSGKSYSGPAHFNTYGIDNLGAYSNKNSEVSEFKITSNEAILQLKKTAGMNQYISNIECPCEVLLEKKVFDEIKRNNTNVFVNNSADASKYFNSAWFYLMAKDYKTSIDRFQAVVNFYIKISKSIDGKELSKKNFDQYRMTMINLGHANLLEGNFKKANEIYNNDILFKDFGKDWGNMSSKEVIKSDWNEFIKNKLITKEELLKFNAEFSILDNF